MTPTVFFGVMAIASAASIGRGFIVAALMDPASFGQYAVVVALGAFCSTVLGMGRIEATLKSFPRLWVDGHAIDTIKVSDRTAAVIAFRAIGVAVLAVATIAAFSKPTWLSPALGVAALALATAWAGLYGSTVRASANLSGVANSTLARAITALIVGAVGSMLASWPGAVAGEIIGALVGSTAARRMASTLVMEHSPANLEARTPPLDAGTRGGIWLFAAFTTAGIPAYLDRAFVAGQFGEHATGTYSFLMLFVAASAAVSGIIAQKLGPQLVRMERQGMSLRIQATLTVRWILACWSVVLVACAVGCTFER